MEEKGRKRMNQEKERAPVDFQARVEKLEKSLNNTWLIMDMLILALEQKQVIDKADLKEAASVQRSEILKVHPEFAEGWPDPWCKFDEPGIRLELDPTKKSAEKVSQERVDGLRYQQSACSKKFCEMFLKKCETNSIFVDVMAELNEWARMLIRLEKIDDLPDINTMETIVIAFQKHLEEFVNAYGGLSGSETSFLISDGVRNYSNLMKLLYRMKNQDTSHS